MGNKRSAPSASAKQPSSISTGTRRAAATNDGKIAINPVAAIPHKTLFHEMAHVLLDHAKDQSVPRAAREVEAEGVALLCCEALGLEGATYARGYLQHWLRDGELTDAMALRIIRTAQCILSAGAHQPARTENLVESSAVT
jgi:hypothetical protein